MCRLKSTISASKIKIAQQARTISEQTALLRQAGIPRAFVLSKKNNVSKDRAAQSRGRSAARKEIVLNSTSVDLFNSEVLSNSETKHAEQSVPLNETPLDRGVEELKNSQQTVLPCDQGDVETGSKNENVSVSRNQWGSESDIHLSQSQVFSNSPIQFKDSSCHIIYSHTHNVNLPQKPVKPVSGVEHRRRIAEDSPAQAAKPLRLKSSRDSSGRVRYRRSGSKFQNTSSKSEKLITLNADGDGNVRLHTSNDEDPNSVQTSPSFLAGSAKMFTITPGMNGSDISDAGTEDDKENPLGVDNEPMSCSMFATYPHDCGTGATEQIAGATTNLRPVIPKKRLLNINQIAELLSTIKKTRNTFPDESVTEGGVVNVVPVTPGVRSVQNILDSGEGGWLAVQQPVKVMDDVMEVEEEEKEGKEEEIGGKEGARNSRTGNTLKEARQQVCNINE